MTDRALELLRELQALGVEVKIEPDEVLIRTGKLEIFCPYSLGTLRTKQSLKTEVTLDGKRIEGQMTAIIVRLAVGEVTQASITFEAYP